MKESPRIIDTIGADFDLNAWIKASEAVSGEIVLEKLIHSLISTALECARAERGVLLLPRGDELRVEAEATAEGRGVAVRLGAAAATSEILSESVLSHVVRTHDIVMLDDASAEERFVSDPYIQRNQIFNATRRGRSCAFP